MHINEQLLGKLLVDQHLVSKDILEQALRLQVGGNRRLGHILVRMRAISDDQLAEVLSQQLGQDLVNIEIEFDKNARKIIPRYLCNQYGVIPLKSKNGNILKVAMANPSDNEAINDLEHYTGMVIEPCLAKHSEIVDQIKKQIPLSSKDFFSPKINAMMLKVMVSILCAITLGLSFVFYDYVRNQIVGQVIETEHELIMTNHDLRVRFKKEGLIYLIGRPAYGDNYIKLSFDKNSDFLKFVDSEKYSFSSEQYNWLNFVTSKIEL